MPGDIFLFSILLTVACSQMPSANCTCVNPFFFRYSFSNAPSTLIKTISFPLKIISPLYHTQKSSKQPKMFRTE